MRIHRSLAAVSLVWIVAPGCGQGGAEDGLGGAAGEAGSSEVPEGFGLACESDRACRTFELLCGATGCAECLTGDDCSGGRVCLGGLCQLQVVCENSLGCPSDQVCNVALGLCVDCVGDADCEHGTCQASLCLAVREWSTGDREESSTGAARGEAEDPLGGQPSSRDAAGGPGG